MNSSSVSIFFRRFLCVLGSTMRASNQPIHRGRQRKHCIRIPKIWLYLVVASWSSIGSIAVAQVAAPESVWDYDPYRVKVWVSVDRGLPLPWRDQDYLLREVQQRAENSFGAAWRVEVEWAPIWQHELVIEEFEKLSLAQLSERDAILVLPKENKELNVIRSIDTAADRLEEIHLGQGDYDTISDALIGSEDPVLKSFFSKLKPSPLSATELTNQVVSGSIECALVRHASFKKGTEKLRIVNARLPWQIDAIERNYDKLMFVAVTQEDQHWVIRTREFDCPMQNMGTPVRHETAHADLLPRIIDHHLAMTFTPVVRIENVRNKRAALRLRAGGMIVASEHPALIYPGDVLVPFVRLDDKSGVPSLLDRVPWTYLAAIDGNGMVYDGLVISGVRGGLEGRTNRRTQRVALRVRPTYDSSNLRFTIRTNQSEMLPGIAVYRRGPTGGDLNLIGHSDWRGVLNVNLADRSSIEYELSNHHANDLASIESGGTDPSLASQDSPTDSDPSQGQDLAVSSSNPSDPATSDGSAETAPVPSKKPMQSLELNVPLYLYYVKNGNNVLARLPIVTGLFQEEIADLPDDRRRLEAEGFIRGLEREILDTIMYRKIMQKRIEKMIELKNVIAAKTLLAELRTAPSYERISEKLEAIQRKVFDPEKGPMPQGVSVRIDSLILQTRKIMQQYLQDTTDRSLELQIDELESSS